MDKFTINRLEQQRLRPVGAAWREWLPFAYRDHELFVTLNTNTPTWPERAQEALELWYKTLNTKTVGQRYYKGDPDAQWRGVAFLEGNSDISDGPQTLHWHILMSPGKALPPEKARECLRADAETGEPVVAGVMRQLWQRGVGASYHRDPKGYAKGTVDVEYIHDHAGLARYVTKRLTGIHRDFERNHNSIITLPLAKAKAEPR